ncbi:MAG: DsbE family thiol:disulfide interchange protein [Steroidobacteraceae bacterium]
MKAGIRYLVPIAALLAIAALLGSGLTHDPRLVPSPLVGKAAPPIVLPEVADPARTFDSANLHGKVWVLNVWASWCVSCRQEHPVLMVLRDQANLPLYGLDYKDTRDAALQWLAAAGNPYLSSASDPQGTVGMNFGVYGVPETYVIDKLGVIRYKQIGPLTPQVVDHTILPLVARLSQ